MKTLTPRHQQSKSGEDIEIVEISCRVEPTESCHDSESARSPADVPSARGNAHKLSYPLRRRIKKDPEDFDDASSPARCILIRGSMAASGRGREGADVAMDFPLFEEWEDPVTHVNF